MTEKIQMLTASIKKNPVAWTGLALFIALILTAFAIIQISTWTIPSKSALGMVILTVYSLTAVSFVCIPELSNMLVKKYAHK